MSGCLYKALLIVLLGLLVILAVLLVPYYPTPNYY